MVKEAVCPWGRLPGDTDVSFEAFCKFRDMKGGRHFNRLIGYATADVSKWYREHGWRSRVAAYDARQDEIRREVDEDALRTTYKDVVAEHKALLADAREICARQLALYVKASQESTTFGMFKFGDMVKMIDLTVKLDRLLHGDTTENVGTATPWDMTRLTRAELVHFQQLLAKVTIKPAGSTP